MLKLERTTAVCHIPRPLLLLACSTFLITISMKRENKFIISEESSKLGETDTISDDKTNL